MTTRHDGCVLLFDLITHCECKMQCIGAHDAMCC
jgi:hypothetical protein